MTVSERLAALRQQMAARSLDACLVVTDDYHGSEYVDDHFKTRAYLSGFTGSAGTLLVLPDSACLWTDGRYFLQADRQLAGSAITLMRAGQPGVPTLSAFLADTLPDGAALAFDGRTVSTRLRRTLEKALAARHIRMADDFDPAAYTWPDRPPLSARPAWAFDSGVTRREKLALLRRDMAAQNAAYLLLTDLTDTAWALELRGGDVACTPVFPAFLLLGQDSAVLCAQEQSFSPTLRAQLAADGVLLRPYGAIYDLLNALPQGTRVMADSATANSRISGCLSGADWLDAPSPAAKRKAVKSPSEQEGFRHAHAQDGAALCRFLYAVKSHPERYTELSASALLHDLRAAQEGFLEDSFPAIVAYGAHGAVVHYEPDAETDVPLERRSLLLVDSGGHYRRGTTDVTRTVALGALTQEERRMFTVVLQGHIHLAMARFPRGAAGENLDALARMPLWQLGLDYDHGTGHGVGCVLSVHESPPAFRWRIAAGASHPPLEEGMILSDEPGYYQPGRFGIRHENLLLVRPAQENFLCFEVLTLAPFDLDALELTLLTAAEKAWLNDYHRRVRETLSPLLEPEIAAWLAEATQTI